MNDSAHPAPPEIPTFEELAADPEIAALLDFEPVARQLQKTNGWTPAMQRMFIGWLAYYGSAGKAAQELGKARSGIDKVYKEEGADSFRAAWDDAVALNERRAMEQVARKRSGTGGMTAPFAKRRKSHAMDDDSPLPGQVRNEHGEWEDEASLRRRGEEAKESIASKLLRIRRIFLPEISASPGKRAAFEILTELPVDWDLAARGEPQPDEPYNAARARQPDMILTAESGWSFGDIGYGPNRMAAARKAINELRAERGQEPIDWSAESAED